jgi:hypothetical protein
VPSPNSRTLTALRRAIDPRYALKVIWDWHLSCEVAAKDSTAAPEIMV